jgi:hypothetical protein
MIAVRCCTFDHGTVYGAAPVPVDHVVAAA